MLIAIAVVVVAAISIAPRRDPRFVGRWVTTSQSGVVSRCELFPDGTGTVQGLAPKVTASFRLRWWNARGQLVVHYTGETALQTAAALMRELACNIRGVQSDELIEHFPVRAIAEDRITFENDWTWERASSAN